MLGEAMQKYGHGDRTGIAGKHIEKDLSRFTGHPRNNHLKMWRGFCAWMVDHYKMNTDPSDGIKRARTAKTDGHIPWTDEQIETFRTFWPIGTMERLAFELIYWTGARVSDAIRLGRGNVKTVRPSGTFSSNQVASFGAVSALAREVVFQISRNSAPMHFRIVRLGA